MGEVTNIMAVKGFPFRNPIQDLDTGESPFTRAFDTLTNAVNVFVGDGATTPVGNLTGSTYTLNTGDIVLGGDSGGLYYYNGSAWILASGGADNTQNDDVILHFQADGAGASDQLIVRSGSGPTDLMRMDINGYTQFSKGVTAPNTETRLFAFEEETDAVDESGHRALYGFMRDLSTANQSAANPQRFGVLGIYAWDSQTSPTNFNMTITGSQPQLAGVGAYFQLSGTGVVSDGIGLAAFSRVVGTSNGGTITRAYGVFSDVGNQGAQGNITTGYSFYATNTGNFAGNGGGSYMVDYYGLYVAASATNKPTNYTGVYVNADATGNNYFAEFRGSERVAGGGEQFITVNDNGTAKYMILYTSADPTLFGADNTQDAALTLTYNNTAGSESFKIRSGPSPVVFFEMDDAGHIAIGDDQVPNSVIRFFVI
jgi:hypothetical protein